MPSDPKRIDHALALAAEGRPGEADTLLAHLAGQDGDPDAAWQLSWLRLRAGDGEGALAILRDFAHHPLCNERLREQLLGERRNDEALAILDLAPAPPGDPRGSVTAAVARHLAGDFAGAAGSCREAIAQAPAHAPAYNHLGRALHNLGQTPAAVAAFERAVHADPRYPEAWHNLGHALRARGQLERASDAFGQALALAPGYRSARLNLGITRFLLDQPEQALACFEALLERNRDDIEAMVNAGLCMQMGGDLAKARQRYDRALELAPDHQATWYYLGALLNEQGDPAAARQALQRALQLMPEDADAWAELAGAHGIVGEFDHAQEAVAAGLKLVPDHALLNIEAARLERRHGDLLGAEARLRRLDPAKLPLRARPQYYFELGSVLDHNLQHAAAFRAFEQANALVAGSPQAQRVDGQAFFDAVDRLSAWLDDGAPSLEDGLDDGDLGADLCFAIGFPGAGDALAGQHLAAHPGVHIIEGQPTLEPLVRTIEGLPGGYPSAIARLDRSDRVALRRMYRMALARHGAGHTPLVLDRQPLRLVHAGLVQALFPRARLLFSLRHPADAVLDNFMRPQPITEATSNFRSLAGTIRLYDAAFGLWQRLEARLSLPIAYVRDEDLQRSPAQEMANVCSFLGLAPAPAPDLPPVGARPPARRSRYREQLQPHLDVLAPHAARWAYSLD